MLGKDLFKVESKVDLSYKRHKSLILFYNPLIGNDAHYLFEFLCLKDNSNRFYEINELLNSLRYTIDSFEECMRRLNKYRLVNTFKKKDEDSYIFVLNNPLTPEEFVKDDLFARDLILKTSGPYYRSLISEIRSVGKHKGYDDVSYRFNPEELSLWSEEKEAYLNKKTDNNYDFGTFFDINAFLKDCELSAFPLKYRSPEVIKEIATMGDLYNIDLESMRPLVFGSIKNGDVEFNMSAFKYRCQKFNPPYKLIEKGNYSVPCLSFLMSKFGGKQPTVLDKKIIYNLANDYYLNTEVINALMEYVLDNNDNVLIEKYIYALANDMHHNDIKTANDCFKRLNYSNKKSNTTKHKFKEPTYDDSKNIEATPEQLKALKRMRGQND